MNKILVNSVLDPSISQPWTAQSLDFLQSSQRADSVGIVAAMAPNQFSAHTPVCLYGGLKHFNGGSSYTFQPAYFAINGEIFPFFGKTLNIATQPILTINSVSDPGPDPLLFSDGIFRNVHMNYYIDINDGALNSGDANYVDLSFIHSAATVDTWHTVGGGGEPAFQNGWTGQPNVFFRKDGNIVTVRGRALSSGSHRTLPVFTLPAGYRPNVTNEWSFASQGVGAVDTNFSGWIGSNGDVQLASSGGADVNITFAVQFTIL